ncbi:hypothetical protein RRG08_017490 [Elysia crispata]|uniref:Uncharacterized protein n=1 Tax=Elysia crispata TaxID=231223 RepID=A0AAE0YI71_9GAST|nr:hypothetical protein RRG08_017490 [Elysia crispata]
MHSLSVVVVRTGQVKRRNETIGDCPTDHKGQVSGDATGCVNNPGRNSTKLQLSRPRGRATTPDQRGSRPLACGPHVNQSRRA